MSRAQQPSILSFFQAKQQQQPPKHAAAPPSQSPQAPQNAAQAHPTRRQHYAPPTPPPAAPPLPSPPASSKPPSTGLPLPVTALPDSIPTPHPGATIVPVTEAHIPALRRINALLLPVNYTESFYAAVLDPAASGLFSRAILWRDPDAAPNAPPKVIGGLVCRIEPSPFHPVSGAYSQSLADAAKKSVAPARSHALYIQSLVLLAPYRSQGLASAAVDGIIAAAAQVSGDRGNGLNIGWVFAHVWTENEDGLRWYGARGFVRDGVLEGYYFKLRPNSAWIVKRAVPTPGGGGTGMVGRVQAYETQAQAGDPAAAVRPSTTAAAVNLGGFSTPTPPTASGGGPPKATRPSGPDHSLSFQNKGPGHEWNDLPEDMVATSRSSSRSNLLPPPVQGASGGGNSGASSRSSSTAPGRKKKERAYPTAAFGS